MNFSFATSSKISSADFQAVSSYLNGTRSWKADLAPAKDPALEYSWDRSGINLLIEEATTFFKEETGVDLPHNTANWGSWVGEAWGKHHPRPADPASDPVEEAARFAGWLKAATRFPNLVHLIERTTSKRGIGSPYTVLNVLALSQHWTSPGKAARALQAVKARSREILAPYGLRPSNAALAAVLEAGPRKVGKAALKVASMTISGETHLRSHKEARTLLSSLSRQSHHREDDTDGVHGFVVASTTHGPVTVETLISTAAKPFRRVVTFLVKAGTRSFHAQMGDYLLVGTKEGPYGRSPAYKDIQTPRDALRAARAAWKKQEQAEAEIGLPDPSKVTLLVTRSDSYSAGNCTPGTEAFVKGHAWTSRWYVPAKWLIATGNPAALRAVRSAARKLAA